MKIKFCFPVLLILAFGFAAYGQSASITKRTTTYKRPHPISGDKTKIIVDRPRVRVSNRAVSRKIERNISFARVMRVDIASEINGKEQWLDAAGFDVSCNKKGVLSVTLWTSGYGQFFSRMSRSILVDLKTGDVVTVKQIFRDLPDLAALVKRYQQAEIERAKVEIPKIEGYGDFDAERWFGTADITVRDLENFTVSDFGVTFTYDYGFPRIMQTAQPEGIFMVPWSEIKPFIRRGGLLGKLVY